MCLDLITLLNCKASIGFNIIYGLVLMFIYVYNLVNPPRWLGVKNQLLRLPCAPCNYHNINLDFVFLSQATFFPCVVRWKWNVAKYKKDFIIHNKCLKWKFRFWATRIKSCIFVWTECFRTLSSDWKSGQGGWCGGGGGVARGGGGQKEGGGERGDSRRRERCRHQRTGTVPLNFASNGKQTCCGRGGGRGGWGGGGGGGVGGGGRRK